MPAMTNYECGDVVLVNFPFTNQQSSKKRPAVVISNMGYVRRRPDVIVLAIIGQIRQAPAFGEPLVEGWKQAGLLKTSAFKPLIATVEQTIVKRTLGRLARPDMARLPMLLQDVLGESSEQSA